MENFSGSNPILTNVTFASNSAAQLGGGICNSAGGNSQISDTILWGNTASTGSQIYNSNISFPILSDSVVQGGCPTGSTCINVITTDPRLGVLGNYGGFTQTIPLLAGSSAIDAGDDTTCAATDQRGVTRPQGAHCDIGAYEYVFPAATLTPTSTETATATVTSTATIPNTPTLTVTPTGTVTQTEIPSTVTVTTTATVPNTPTLTVTSTVTVTPTITATPTISLPAAPVLSAPADAAVLIGTPNFTWLASATASTYQFEYASNASFDSPIYTSTELVGFSVTPPTMAPGAYFWHTRAKDAAGNWSVWSAARTVTIQAAVPLAPALTAPVNAFLTNDTTPSFSWNAVAYGNTYQLEISKTTNFAVKLRSFRGAPGILTYTAAALPNGVYYWHARALNIKNAAGAWSATRSFTIDITPPAAPVLSKPVAGTKVIGTPAFNWLAAATATQYQFQYDNNANFSSPTYTSAELAVRSFSPPAMVAGTYSWRVRARDAAGNWGKWSAARVIVIKP